MPDELVSNQDAARVPTPNFAPSPAVRTVVAPGIQATAAAIQAAFYRRPEVEALLESTAALAMEHARMPLADDRSPTFSSLIEQSLKMIHAALCADSGVRAWLDPPSVSNLLLRRLAELSGQPINDPTLLPVKLRQLPGIRTHFYTLPNGRSTLGLEGAPSERERLKPYVDWVATVEGAPPSPTGRPQGRKTALTPFQEQLARKAMELQKRGLNWTQITRLCDSKDRRTLEKYIARLKESGG